MANESLIVTGAEQDRQERRTQGEGGVAAAIPTRLIGKRVGTRRILSTKSEGDQGSPPETKRARVLLGDLIPPRSRKARVTPKAGNEKKPFQPLLKEFPRDALNYRQVACEGDAVIYADGFTFTDNDVAFAQLRALRSGR